MIFEIGSDGEIRDIAWCLANQKRIVVRDSKSMLVRLFNIVWARITRQTFR